MSVETIQKLLLACIPVYFYFVPEGLFPFFYRKYIKSAVYEIAPKNPGAFDHIEDLKLRVTRVLRFITFLSIVLVTVIAVFYSKEHHTFFYKDCLLVALLIVLLGLSGLSIHLNIRRKFLINGLESWLERLIVFSTMPLFYFWG